MFTTLINRRAAHAGWHKIPWHDPAFSRRMLAEHLSQAHDAASRRFSIIDQQVEWIHRKVLGGQPARILDVGCGPGFYTGRYTALGHKCTGIDISPASIAYAREHHPGSDYILGDVRTLDYGQGYDLVALIYGELNAFAPEDAAGIIDKAHAALKPGGTLLLEVHTYAAIHRFGHQPPASPNNTAEAGLFGDAPYLCLEESRFDADRAISDYYVYDTDSGAMQQYTAMHQGYTDDEYRRLLRDFTPVLFYPALTGDAAPADLFVIAAEK